MSLIDTNTNWNFKDTLSGLLDQIFGRFNVNPDIKVDTVKFELSNQQILLFAGLLIGSYFLFKKVKI